MLKKMYFSQLRFFILSIIILSSFVFSFGVLASSSDGTIPAATSTATSSLGFAWGSNIGWVNFGATFGNVHITDSGLSGYAWTAINGWINLNPSAAFYVTNNGEGVLGGYAWGEQLGWISFTGVTIDSQGEFHGYATIDQDGSKISFNCSNTTYNANSCGSFSFKLITDWRPVSTRSSGGGGGAPPLQGGLISAPHVEAYNGPLVMLPQQSGNLTQNVSLGNAVVSVPANGIPESLTFIITEEPLTKTNLNLVTRDQESLGFYDVRAINQRGELVRKFSKFIKINLPVPGNLKDAAELQLYYVDETSNKLIVISDAVFDLKNKTVQFQVDYLTKFVVLKGNLDESIAESEIISSIKEALGFETSVESKPKSKVITKIKPSVEVEVPVDASGTSFPAPVTESLPGLPLNVTFEVVNNKIEKSQDLSVRLKFDEFNRQPIPVNLIFVIYDKDGKQLYSTQDNIVADNQDEYLKEFPDLDLPFGQYTIIVNTPDGLRITGDLQEGFEVIKSGESFWQRDCSLGQFKFRCYWWPVIVMAVIIVLWWILVKIRKDDEKKFVVQY